MHQHPPAPFIVGVPRSGTTLLRLMLDSHPELAIPQETHFLPGLVMLKLGEDCFRSCFVHPPLLQMHRVQAFLSDTARESFLHNLVQSMFWDDFQLSPAQLQQALSGLKPFTVADGVRCFYRLYAARMSKNRWGDKTPLYGMFMQAIESLLPEAHFIHIVRDVRDVAVSFKERPHWEGSSNVQFTATLWKEFLTEVHRQAPQVRHFMEVYYEELVTDPRNVLQRISDFIELAFHPQMEQYHNNAQSRLAEIEDSRDIAGNISIPKARKLGNYRNAMNPIDPTRIGHWKYELEDREKEQIESIAGVTLKLAGYLK